jgi:protein-tyrosine phosphatase
LTQRVLAWDGCLNVRDLGGLPIEGGGQTRFGVVVRADSIRGLSDAGWQALVDYGVRTAVDLRGAWETEDDPPRELPIEIVHLPIDPRQAPLAWRWPSMVDAYRALLERFPRPLAEAVATIGRSDQAVVVHCMGGRDRTGLACGLLLRLVGVDLETIAADHAISDEMFAPTLRKWLASASDEEERGRRTRVSVAADRTLAEVLGELEERVGSVEAYLLAAGVSMHDLERAAARLQH